VQTDIKQLDPVTKSITITIDAETVAKDYQKFLSRSARDIQIPGFRKGKAPLPMVERMYGETVKEYFLKDATDDYFNEAIKEHQIGYLLMPHVKDIQWEKGSEFKAEIEIEHEPEVELSIPDPLVVPHDAISLDDEVDRFLKKMAEENATYIQVEEVIADDAVECEIKISVGDETLTYTGVLFAGEAMPQRSVAELVGKKVGDVVEAQLSGNTIKLVTRAKIDKLDNNTSYSCSLMVNDIRRYVEPAIDDEFAKDLDHEDLASLKAQIANDMKLRLEHNNYDSENNAIIHKLFADSPFDLPKRTIEYLAREEAAKVEDKRYQQYYEYQFRMQFSQQMINVYIVKALNRLLNPVLEDAALEQYIEHEAILEDIPVGAWKEKHADRLNTDDFKDEARTWTMLRSLATKAEFVKPEPPAETNSSLASTEDLDSDTSSVKPTKKAKNSAKKQTEPSPEASETENPVADDSTANEENA